MAKTMLVGDAAFMCMMIEKILTRSGYSDFVEVQDGAEAVKKYGEEKPDMIIMDIMAPNVGGLQVSKKIKESDTSAKVIVCTAMKRGSMVVDATRSDARDFIVKSFNAEHIVQAVNLILGK